MTLYQPLNGQPSPVTSFQIFLVCNQRIKWRAVPCCAGRLGRDLHMSVPLRVGSVTGSSGSYRQTFRCPKMHHGLSEAAPWKMPSLLLCWCVCIPSEKKRGMCIVRSTLYSDIAHVEVKKRLIRNFLHRKHLHCRAELQTILQRNMVESREVDYGAQPEKE